MSGKEVNNVLLGEPSGSKSRCFLLELPGELRNRIYDFALENKMILFTPRRAQDAPKELTVHPYTRGSHFRKIMRNIKPEGFPFTCQEDNDEKLRKRTIRKFRGLNQVCRLIRAEYLPLYKRTTAHRVCHMDMNNYLNMVLIPECRRMGQEAVPLPTGDCVDTKSYYNAVADQELAARQCISRAVIIDCKSWHQWEGVPRRDGIGPTIDILPFLKFCMTAPGIQVQCGYNVCRCCGFTWAGQRKNLNRIFQAWRFPKLAAWLEASVDKVSLSWPTNVTFHIKKGHGKKWMGDWMADFTKSPELQDWEAEVGLCNDDKRFNIVDFYCFKDEWERNFGREDRETDAVDGEKLEEEAFWKTSDKKNGEKSKKLREKVRCGKTKLERNKGHHQRRSS